MKQECRGASMRGIAWPPLVHIVSLAIILVSCASEKRPDPLGPNDIGVVEGTVSAGGTGIEATVVARLENQSWWPAACRVDTDSTGHFRLELPWGRYRIGAERVAGQDSYSEPVLSSPAIVVGPWVRRVNLAGGRVTVRVAMPGDLDGRAFHVRIASECGILTSTDTVKAGTLESTFPMAPAGPTHVWYSVANAPLGHAHWLPGAADLEDAQFFDVSSSRPTLIEGSVNSYAVIHGEVHGAWEAAGASPPEVWAFGADSSAVASTTVRSDGSYTLDLMRARPVKICTVSWPEIVQWLGGETFSQATLYNVNPGDRLESVSLLESGILCTLEGFDTRTSTRPGFFLREQASPSITIHPTTYPTWNDTNRVAICNLRPGRYFLQIFHNCWGSEDWLNLWYDGTSELSEATPIVLGEGQLASITVRLVEGGRIDGRTLNSTGSPKRTSVFLYARGERTCERWSDGSYSFRALENGDYKVAVYGSRGLWWYPGTAYPDSAGVLSIRDHAALSGIEWRIP